MNNKIMIEAMEKLIKTAQKQFDKAARFSNYARMAVLDGYKSGLEEALEIIKIAPEKKTEEAKVNP